MPFEFDLAKFGAKGLFWGVFGLLFAFLVLSRTCHHEDKIPIVTVETTPPIEPKILEPVLEVHEQAAVTDQDNQKKTEAVNKEVEHKVVKAITKIKANTTINQQEKDRQIGEAQISSLQELYGSYYGPPTEAPLVSPLPSGTS